MQKERMQMPTRLEIGGADKEKDEGSGPWWFAYIDVADFICKSMALLVCNRSRTSSLRSWAALTPSISTDWWQLWPLAGCDVITAKESTVHEGKGGTGWLAWMIIKMKSRSKKKKKC